MSYEDIKKQFRQDLKMDQKNNMKLFLKRESVYNKIQGIRVGDFIKEKNGRLTRVTHIWPDGSVQTGGNGGSYYLGNRYMEYSGSLDHGYNKLNLRRINTTKVGRVWFFKNDWHTADNAVHYNMKFRVYEVI